MNKLLFTLSLVVLVAVPAYSTDTEPSLLSSFESLTPEQRDQMIEGMKQVVYGKVEEKCMNQTGSDEAFNKIKEALEHTIQCFHNFVNITEMQKEIEKEAPEGNLEVVFNKYCYKKQDILTCFENFATSFQPCLNETEIAKKDVLVKVVNRLVSFVCYKDGDQIALFLSEKGPECLSSQQGGIADCVQTSYGKYVDPDGNFKVETVNEDQQCQEVRDIQVCIVNELEKCAQTTPANLVDSMFKAILNETSCPPLNSASQNSFSLVLMSTILMSLITKFFIH